MKKIWPIMFLLITIILSGCREEGAPASTIECPVCSIQTAQDSQFCSSCGTSLVALPSPVTDEHEVATNPVTTTYLNLASDLIAKKEYDSAVEILQKGLAETGDEQLGELLKNTLLLQTSQQGTPPPNAEETHENDQTSPPPQSSKSQAFDVAPYLGLWSEPDLGWQLGGYTMELTSNGESLTIAIRLTGPAPYSLVTDIYSEISLHELLSNSLRISVSDDGWGNAGTIELLFAEDSIYCQISDVKSIDGFETMFGLQNCCFTFFRNDLAYTALYYTEEMYYSAFPENVPSEPIVPQPVVDTSKASGLLASMGLTEEAFRAGCQKLFSDNFQIGKPDGTEARYTELVSYPGNYIDKHFVIDNISSEDFTISYKGMSSDGYPYYEDLGGYENSAVIYDFRDDPYSPNFVTGDVMRPYVIFKGIRTVNGNDWLVFWMLSVDTQEEAHKLDSAAKDQLKERQSAQGQSDLQSAIDRLKEMNKDLILP